MNSINETLLHLAESWVSLAILKSVGYTCTPWHNWHFLHKQQKIRKKKKQQNKNLFTSDPPSLQTQKADLSVSSKTV